jgi:predicted metal-binding protein
MAEVEMESGELILPGASTESAVDPIAGTVSSKQERDEETAMSRIAILYCKKIQDHSCIACAKCFKGMKEKNGEFARYDEIELVGMTDCGDCPGLAVPRVKLLSEVTRSLDRPIDAVHLGTCIKLAMETADCPIDFEFLATMLEQKFGYDVILGTHSY